MDLTNCRVNLSDEYKTITLCGSTKFKKTFDKINIILTLNDKFVLSKTIWTHSTFDRIDISKDQEYQLDRLHKQKIAMSDAVFVINENNYCGESTKSEIQYALNLNKPVFYCFDYDGKLNYYNDALFTQQPTIYERWATDEGM